MTIFARNWPPVALLACAAALGVAHAFETFGHLAPCELCLKARELYWWTMALAAVGVIVVYARSSLNGVLCGLLAVAFLCGVGLAVYHAGVEWKLWAGPASCSGGTRSVGMADLGKLLRGGGGAPQCDQAAWVFLGLSMAGWNAVYSLILAAGSAWAARKAWR